MRQHFLFIILLMLHFSAGAQVTETSATEQEFENVASGNEEAEIEDDSYVQQMAQFLKHPVNINTADEEKLGELQVLDALQIQQLIAYRSLLGRFLSIYELQSVPGWDIQTIHKIKQYITVTNDAGISEDIHTRLKSGDHSLLLRASQVLERSKGYLIDPSSAKSNYPGSPLKLLMRYKYQYRNLLQFGILGEKDAGEQFFKGKQKQGFDFYSGHIFFRNAGIIKAFALGDYTINMGQGLIQWQSLAFKKGADVLGIKRQSAVLRPYNSAGEINFHRGVAATAGKGKWEATFFFSFRKLDANLIRADSLNDIDIVSSLQTSGYHRTQSETEDKHIQQQLAFGGNCSFRHKNLHLGINAVKYSFQYPVDKGNDPYNYYTQSGKQSGNYSFDYSYTFRNMHLFGELAFTDKNASAFVNGLLISMSQSVDLGILYRNISKRYYSLYTNALTEASYPVNEKGLYSGISIRPGGQWQIDAYADFYKFPWVKYRVDAPSAGSDYFIQVSYRPNRQLEIYSRYKQESKAINQNLNELVFNQVINQPRKSWRTQINYSISKQFLLRIRDEMVWFNKPGDAGSDGFLCYADLTYKPEFKPFSANLRLQYFETEDYNSRLYTYENDVLYSYSIPVFYEKGYRYYINASYSFFKNLAAWLKISQTIHPQRNTIGSGLDEINGNRKTALKIQLLYKF